MTPYETLDYNGGAARESHNRQPITSFKLKQGLQK